MGYRAAAQHSRHFDRNMAPLAIDAGLGELGRFGYYASVGTDCSICMGVCPYSRPNRGLHRLARWAICSMAENLRVLEGVKGNGITN
jgi:hypothetical protein